MRVPGPVPRRSGGVRLVVTAAFAVLLAGVGWVAPARAATIEGGDLTVGSSTTVTSTAQGDVYWYTVQVPASTGLALRSLTSQAPSRANVALYASGYVRGSGALPQVASDLGNQPGDPTLLTLASSSVARTMLVQVTIAVPGVLPLDVSTFQNLGPLPLAFGTDTTVTLDVPRQQATLTFRGIAGHRLGTTVRASTFPANSGLGVTLSGPGVSGGGIYTTGITQPGWIMQDATYTITVSPWSPVTGSLVLRIDDVQDLTSSADYGAVQTVNLTTPWTQSSTTFHRVPGSYLRLDVLSADVKRADGSPGSVELSTLPQRATGTVMAIIASGGGPTSLVSVSPMGDSATGTVLVKPRDDATGTISFRLTAVPENPVQPLVVGTATPVDLQPGGTTRRYTVGLTAGQRYVLAVADVSLTGNVHADPGVAVSLHSPDQNQNSASLLATVSPGSSFVYLLTPATTGDYVVTLRAIDVAVGSATLQVRPLADVEVPLVNGASATATFEAPNDTVLLTSPGTADPTLPSITVDATTLIDHGGSRASASLVFEQDGAPVRWGEENVAPDDAGTTFPAPVALDPTRPWRLRVGVSSGVTGTVSVSLRKPETTARTVSLGATTPVTFQAYGDTTTLTFTPHPGRPLLVERTGATTATLVHLTTADGTPIGVVDDQPDYAEYPPVDSAAPLTLTVALDPYHPRAGNVGVTVRDVDSPSFTATRPTTVSWTAWQNPRILVRGQRGHRLTLDLTATASSPDQWLPLTLVTPTGRSAMGAVQPTEHPFLDLGVLPVTGDYAIEFDPQGRTAGSLVAEVAQVLDLHRSVGLGSPTTVSFTKPGQTATLTVRVPAGAQLSWKATLRGDLTGDLRLSGPPGQNAYAPLSSGGTFSTNPLPAGEYVVLVDPLERATGSVTITLTAAPDDRTPG